MSQLTGVWPAPSLIRAWRFRSSTTSAATMAAARAAARAEARRSELDAAPLWRQRLLEKDFFQYTNLVLACSYEGPPGRPADHLFKCRIGKFHAPFLTLSKGNRLPGLTAVRSIIESLLRMLPSLLLGRVQTDRHGGGQRHRGHDRLGGGRRHHCGHRSSRSSSGAASLSHPETVFLLFLESSSDQSQIKVSS